MKRPFYSNIGKRLPNVGSVSQTLQIASIVLLVTATLLTVGNYIYAAVENNNIDADLTAKFNNISFVNGTSGATGATGQPGSSSSGQSGTSFYIGTCGGSPPPSNLCNVTSDGWLTLCKDTLRVYECVSGSWVFQTTLQGPTGMSGASGGSGALGASGSTGATGSSITGATGASGALGFTGASGVSGSTGAPGFTGGTGATGRSGSTGASGGTATGATGAAGTIYNVYWVATGQGSANTLAYSFDGRVWTGLGTGVMSVANAVTYSQPLNMWVATGSATAVSNNGVAWSIVTVPGLTTGYTVTWSSSQRLFVLGGAGGDLLYYSSDGYTWTGVGTAISSLGLTAVLGSAYSPAENRWVVCGNASATNNAAYATLPSATWTGLGLFFTGNNCNGVCTSNGAITRSWLLVGSGGTNVASSVTGAGPFIAWAGSPFGNVNKSTACAYGNGQYLVAGNGVAKLVNSSDGTTSSPITSVGITTSVNALVYSSDLGQWDAAGAGTNSLAWSPMNGTGWTGVTTTTIFDTAGTGIAVIASSRKRDTDLTSVLPTDRLQPFRGQYFVYIPHITLAPATIQPLLRNALERLYRRQ